MSTKLRLADDQSVEGAISELAFAAEHVPMYRKLVERAGVTPAALESARDLARIPTTEKADFRRNFPVGVLAKGRTLNEEAVYRSQSSGTTAERLVTVAERFMLASRMFTTLSVNEPVQDTIVSGQRLVRYAPPNCSDVECSTPLSTIEDRTLPGGTLVLTVAHDVFATPDTMCKKAIAEWREYRPTYHYSDPTHLAFLARRARALGLELPPCDVVLLTYTYPAHVARRQLRSALPSTPILRLYSMSEFGWIAIECEHGEMHVNTESFYVEVLDPAGAPSPSGELGELVLTSIGDRLSPHIRYRTGDLVRWHEEPCACGHAFPRMTVEGRVTGVVRRDDDVVLTPRELDEIVGPMPGVDVYQLSQGADARLVFQVIANDAFRETEVAEATAAIRDRLGGVDLEWKKADYISAERSGKFATLTPISLPAEAR